MRQWTSRSPPGGADCALPAGRRVAEPDPCVPRAARLRGRSSAPDSGEDIPRVSSRSSQPDHRSSRGFYRCCAASPDGRIRSGAWYLLRGLVAALRALELGAEVTLLEKGDRLGGSFVYSSGYLWSYKDLPTFRREAPGGDITLQRLILERLGPDLEWLEGHGAAVLTRETGNPLTIGARLDPEQTVAALADRIAAAGGRVLLGTALRGLVRDPEGHIAGVRGRRT